MAGDKEALLSMGFDSARVECSFFVKLVCKRDIDLPYLGALKATGNRGLQPAMDHILEHEGDSVPDLGGVSEQAVRSVPMDVDDDEDTEALKSLGVVVRDAVEAKVRIV